MGLTGGDVLGNVAQHYASSRGRGTNGKGFLSFLGWGKRRRGEGGTPPGPTRKRTPFFIPPEMMRLEEQGEGEEGGAAVGGDNVVDGPEVAYSWQQESEVEARALTDEEESEAEEVAAVLVSRMTRSSRTATTTTADGNGGLEVEEETVVEEEEEELFIVTDSETAEQLLAVADAAAAAAEADKDDGIPNGRSLLASLSVIGGGLPLKRGGSDALCIKATNPAVGAAAVSKGPQQPQQQPQQPAAAVVTTTTAAATDDGDMDVDVDVDEDVDEVATATELEEEEEEHDEALPSGGVAHVRTTTTTTRATTVARHVHTHTHRHVHTERRHTALLAGPGAAAHQGLSDAALGARFRAATARRIAALAPEQRAALEELRAYLYGAEVAPERVRAADQLVVCGDRGAMMLAFLARKNFNVETAKRSFDRVIAWRCVYVFVFN